jgi:hypothetical protein
VVPAGLAVLLLGVLVGDAVAQTSFAPYYGKNRIRYDNFEWYIYDSDHFEIYYYPELEEHLERVASYAESAYQHISSELKHDLAFKVPLIVYKTHSEFQQQNVIPGDVPEGVAAFAEPMRDRMVLPIDEPPDMLYRLITHELTHIFEFDIIPRSLVSAGIPLWVDEGLADYMAGAWRPLDMMTVRDAAVTDIVPQMSRLEGYGAFSNPRLIYNLGHAVFEFIESRWGKEGIRQFLFSLRRSAIGGGDSAYEDALQLSPEDFDAEFDKYIKDRFKPFRDKERPADYGKNLAPSPERTRFTTALSIEPSPSGDLLAVAAGNGKERELDLILISSADGQVVRNLTPGFDQDHGFEYISLPGARFNTVPWMSWSPVGDRLAFFVRTAKSKSLALENVLTRNLEQRVKLDMVDEPESPDIGPNGRRVVFSALKDGIGDIYMVDLETEEVTNLTNDDLADYAPTFSPNGRYLVYVTRVSGNDKLFRLDLESGEKTQLTFGTHDEAAAQFVDEQTIVFASTATDPTQPIDPEVARNGAIYNTWTLNLQNGELRQFTDALGGNVSTVVLSAPDETESRVGFVTYFKGEYGIHTLTREEPLSIAASEDFGAPGPVIDFQAPLSHTLVQANSRKKGAFEKLFLEGRPPVNVGVTSGGDVLGASAITFTDVLGDKQFSLYAASISQYRTISGSYLNTSRRLQYAAQGFSQTEFFFGLQSGLISPTFQFFNRDDSIATRTTQGGSVFAIYPFDRFRRLELSTGLVQYKEEFRDPVLEQQAQDYQEAVYGGQIFRSGTVMPMSATFVQETTVFREYGPLAGNTYRMRYEFAPGAGGLLGRQTVDLDARYYLRIGTNGVLALRGRGFRSWGDFPDFTYFGGNSELRGYRYLEFIGHKAFFTNAELRFPLIEAMLTPIGILGGVRGVVFFNLGGAAFEGEPFKVASSSDQLVRAITGSQIDPTTGAQVPVLGPPTQISGFRLEDGRASYGLGLETFALGFPIHFDWSWRTLFNKAWEDALYANSGGSREFRKARFDVWIGYDF